MLIFTIFFQRNDYAEVLHYLIMSKKFDPHRRDQHGKTLLFTAVMNENSKILTYLIKRVICFISFYFNSPNSTVRFDYLFFLFKWPSIDINESCDSGNTPLHAAVNKGNIELVEIILQSLKQKNISNESKTERAVHLLDINKTNPKCMNATALHLAVWNDFNEIAIRLVQADADPYLKMNDMDAFDMTRESKNEVLHDLLIEYANMNPRLIKR